MSTHASGNALTLPLVSMVVMPAAVVGVLAYPFGLDGPIWHLMGVAVDGVLRVSAWVSALSGSTVVVPAFGAGALGFLAVAILVLTLFVSPLRWLAVAPALIGLWLAVTAKRFDLYVDRDGAGAAVRNTGDNSCCSGVRRPSWSNSGSRRTATRENTLIRPSSKVCGAMLSDAR